MQSQVLRYIRFFIFGCGGILLLLMLLYGPWMLQAKQITIPDISIANFMIRDTSSFFPMHQEAAEQLIGMLSKTPNNDEFFKRLKEGVAAWEKEGYTIGK